MTKEEKTAYVLMFGKREVFTAPDGSAYCSQCPRCKDILTWENPDENVKGDEITCTGCNKTFLANVSEPEVLKGWHAWSLAKG